jgi:hypothetical protein
MNSLPRPSPKSPTPEGNLTAHACGPNLLPSGTCAGGHDAPPAPFIQTEDAYRLPFSKMPNTTRLGTKRHHACWIDDQAAGRLK